MLNITDLKNKIISGYLITKEEALELLEVPSKDLFTAADEIRKHFCGNNFDVCTIMNIKNGDCSEDCKFCAQSSHYNTDIDKYPLMNKDNLKQITLDLLDKGFKRVGYVSSGRSVSDDEFNTILEVIYDLKNMENDLRICLSIGLLNTFQIQKLKKVGVSRIHCNMESSESYFPQVCTTHSYYNKTACVNEVGSQKMSICSGGIFGIGESFEDRIDLAFTLRHLKSKSIPINILNPIQGTPYENYEILSNEEVCRIIAIFRLINPDAYIRMAGGRSLLPDYGRKAFMSGSNAAIMGNMLTTSGVSFEEDLKMIDELGYEIIYDINSI